MFVEKAGMHCWCLGSYDKANANSSANYCDDNSKYLINLFLISRHLERLADHATNIAEEVIYLIEGEIVRHAQHDQE